MVAELLKTEIDTYTLVDSYYSFLFVCYGNKVKVLETDLSKLDFQLNTYGFRDDTEKGIFFLVSMRFNGMLAAGLLNEGKSPNYDVMYHLINRYPIYNGKPYYQFTELNFPDFKAKLFSDTEPSSYKTYYINNYYEVLLAHLSCMEHKGEKEKILHLINESILSQEIYLQYSQKEKELRKLLTKYKK